MEEKQQNSPSQGTSATTLVRSAIVDKYIIQCRPQNVYFDCSTSMRGRGREAFSAEIL